VTIEPSAVLALLLPICHWFESRGFAYQIGGSFASSLHGVPRQTRDIDIVVDFPESAAAPFERDFSREYYVDSSQIKCAVREHRSFNLVHLDSGMKIDLFVAGTTAFDEMEMQRSVELLLDNHSSHRFPVKSAEDTVLRKLMWYEQDGRVSSQQWNDVLGVLKVQQETLDRLYLDHWSSMLGIASLLQLAIEDAWQ